jgi:hypothetical protein
MTVSIDARVKTVIIHENGGGELRLIDRPPSRPGDTGGIAGQSVLVFQSAPEEVTGLNGLDVWGSSERLMLGDKEIAQRIGYTRIVFVDRATFNAALTDYHRNGR